MVYLQNLQIKLDFAILKTCFLGGFVNRKFSPPTLPLSPLAQV
jgi:hypothetical protein